MDDIMNNDLFTLFINKIPTEWTEDDLRKPAKQPDCQPLGFISYKTEQECYAAIDLLNNKICESSCFIYCPAATKHFIAANLAIILTGVGTNDFVQTSYHNYFAMYFTMGSFPTPQFSNYNRSCIEDVQTQVNRDRLANYFSDGMGNKELRVMVPNNVTQSSQNAARFPPTREPSYTDNIMEWFLGGGVIKAQPSQETASSNLDDVNPWGSGVWGESKKAQETPSSNVDNAKPLGSGCWGESIKNIDSDWDTDAINKDSKEKSAVRYITDTISTSWTQEELNSHYTDYNVRKKQTVAEDLEENDD
ncbi:unnamed protein product [Gordionus sp. m RMFG-2023]